MKKIIKAIFFIIFIASLALNALLLYNAKYINKNTDNCDIEIDKNFSKTELGELFKEYQVKEGLATSDSVAVWNIDKITYKGFFTSDGRKLYYIYETFSCLEGTTCVNASNAEIDDNYNVKATYVVAVNDKNPEIKFYILDESILKNSDFVAENEYDLK